MKRHMYAAVAIAVGISAALVTARVSAQGGPPAGSNNVAALAAKPTPKTADGHPDLNGTWAGRGDPAAGFASGNKEADGSVCIIGCAPAGARRGGGPGGAGGPGGPGRGGPGAAAAGRPGGPGGGGRGGAPNFPTYKSEFLAKVKELSDKQVEMDTALRCQVPGVPRIGPPSKVVQTAKEVVLLYDDLNGSFFRIVPIDGRGPRKDLPSSYLGDAVGHWEGDTLVIETVNFNDETWLTDNGAFHTKDLKVVERLRRVGDTIEYRATAIDPAVLAQPWELRPRTLSLSADELEETARCEDRTIDHVVDGTHHDNPR